MSELETKETNKNDNDNKLTKNYYIKASSY